MAAFRLGAFPWITRNKLPVDCSNLGFCGVGRLGLLDIHRCETGAAWRGFRSLDQASARLERARNATPSSSPWTLLGDIARTSIA